MTDTEILSQPSLKNPDKCPQCRGYGWNSIGASIGYFMPMSKRDYEQRFKTQKKIKCPWCGCGDISTGLMWDALNKEKIRMDEVERTIERENAENGLRMAPTASSDYVSSGLEVKKNEK